MPLWSQGLVGGVSFPSPKHKHHEDHEDQEVLTHEISGNRHGGCVHKVPDIHVKVPLHRFTPVQPQVWVVPVITWIPLLL